MSKTRSGAPKRLAAGLLAGALAVFGLALAPHAGAIEDVESERIAGATRYGTAAAIAVGEEDNDETDVFEDAGTVILATGENFPDALAASGLAGANAPAPILLTRTAELSQEALAALDQIEPSLVIIVGGTAAVSNNVEDTLEDEGFTTDRVAGLNRFGTAADIARAMADTIDLGTTALIANGLNYPDALAGGPMAYSEGWPILLVTPTSIPDETEDVIDELGIDEIIILGGTAAVGASVEEQLEDMTGDDEALRLAGNNRFSTATDIADYEIDELGYAATNILLASGVNFPDALAGGPLGGEMGAPIILTSGTGLPQESADWLDANSDRIENIWVLGGPAAVPDDVIEEAEEAAETVDNDDDTPGSGSNPSVTTGPELQSVTFVSQSSASVATYRFTFDEVVTGIAPVPGSFHLYNNNSATPFNGTGASVETADTKSVLVTFNITAEQRAALTVATVDANAVNDIDNPVGLRGNPEGDVALSPAAVPAGSTLAPDLVSVGNFRINATGDGTLVDFTFDEAAIERSNLDFTLLPTVQTAANDDRDASVVISGRGTTVITTQFNHPIGSPISSADFARGFVEPGGVQDSTGNTSPLHAADISNSGNSNAPDLVSATFQPDTTSSASLPNDTVVYTFDQPVSVTTVGNFAVYNQAGATIAATGATVSSTNANEVNATFADGSLDTAVGANVDEGAVTAASGSAFTNEEDEVSVTGVTFTGGRTNGPDLIAVNVVVLATDAFTGQPSSYGVVYTFDEAVSATLGAPALYAIYNANNVETNPTTVTRGGTAGSTTTTSQVVASGFTASQATGAVLGTVDNGAVTDGTNQNPEGAEAAAQPA